MDFKIIENSLILFVDKSIYNEDVIHKCFYWYGGSFNVDIRDYAEDQFQIIIKPLTQSKQKLDFIPVVEKIKRDLVDFKLRDIVTKETKNIRELIVAKAFAYYALEDNPPGEVSDPVGFNPNGFDENG